MPGIEPMGNDSRSIVEKQERDSNVRPCSVRENRPQPDRAAAVDQSADRRCNAVERASDLRKRSAGEAAEVNSSRHLYACDALSRACPRCSPITTGRPDDGQQFAAPAVPHGLPAWHHSERLRPADTIRRTPCQI